MNTVLSGTGPVSLSASGRGALNAAPFTPSAYDHDLTMNDTAQSIPIARGVKKLRVVNDGVEGQGIRIAFGATAAEAEDALTMSGGAATTGLWISGAASTAHHPPEIIGVPANAKFYAVANDTASNTQSVYISQGV